jgi:hypothetical protein
MRGVRCEHSVDRAGELSPGSVSRRVHILNCFARPSGFSPEGHANIRDVSGRARQEFVVIAAFHDDANLKTEAATNSVG